MLLAANVDGLAPDWAFFVRVVVDSDSLRPLASREGLYEDETLAIVREAIGDAVRNWLVTLADHEPERLQELVRVHALALKALAVHDDELLALFARWLPVETSMGRMTILEAATRSSSYVRYAESLDTFRQLVQVAAAQGVLLVNGGYTYDTELLARLPAVVPGVTTEAVTPADLLADLADVSDADWPAASALAARGTELLAALDCAVTVRDFSPSSVPCLYLLGDAARFRRSAEEAVEMSGGFWGSLVSGVVGSSGPDPQAQLCLNFRNPLVRGLAGRSGPDLGTALEVLYLQAMLLGRHPLRGRELSLLSRSLTKLLESGSS
jgi:molecular chaperone HtpG